jgi:hypothetical protein
MEIGSFLWRIKNYGLRASLLYILNRISFDYKENSVIFLSDSAVLEEKVGVKDALISTDEMQKELELAFEGIKLRLQNHEIKNVFGEPSFTRVLVLGILIKSKKFSQVIETGTQNGVSAILLAGLNKKYNANLKIHSFDVVSQPRINDPDITFYVLDQPVRKNFCRLTNQINLPNSVFFHDSDHSKENMSFEFDWAWNNLNVSALVSDDIENNSAFTSFCNINSLSPLYFKFDTGPSVGLVLRD